MRISRNSYTGRFALTFAVLAAVLMAGFFPLSDLSAANDSPVAKPSHAESSRGHAHLRNRREVLSAAAANAGTRAVPQASPPASVLSEARLLSPAGGYSPDVAVDHLGRAHVVWSGLDFHVYYAQVDSNNNITVPATSVYDFVNTNLPRVTVDASGDAHIIATSPAPSSFLIYLKVRDGARLLLKAFTMFPLGVFDSEDDAFPSIDINPQTGLPVIAAEVRLSWHYDVNGFPVYRWNEELSVISLDATGNPDRSSRWSAYYLRNSSGPTLRAQFPDVAVDFLGTTHCVWLHRDPSWSGSSIGYGRSTHTTEWTEIANSRTAVDGPEIARGKSSGTAEIVWSTTANTAIWQEIDHNGVTAIDDSVVSGPDARVSRPNIASFSDEVFVGWADSREGATSDIYSTSVVGGSPEFNVSESSGTAFNHAIAAASPRSLRFAWQDTRNGPSQIFYRGASSSPSLTLHQLRQDGLISARTTQPTPRCK